MGAQYPHPLDSRSFSYLVVSAIPACPEIGKSLRCPSIPCPKEDLPEKSSGGVCVKLTYSSSPKVIKTFRGKTPIRQSGIGKPLGEYLSYQTILNRQMPPLSRLDAYLTRENLREYLTTQGLCSLSTGVEDLDPFWSAIVEPPITNESLSELDLAKIVYNARLRHDLNFGHEIAFKPNTSGRRGLQKEQEGKQYWKAITIELQLYLRSWFCDRPKSPLLRPSKMYPWVWRPPLLHTVPQRLPRMLAAIREIVKNLVPGIYWNAVDERFDVALRMQELENGVCDLLGLISWLSKLLLKSCSPLRDASVVEMVSTTRKGIMEKDTAILVDSLKKLFDILEAMKLVRFYYPPRDTKI